MSDQPTIALVHWTTYGTAWWSIGLDVEKNEVFEEQDWPATDNTDSELLGVTLSTGEELKLMVEMPGDDIDVPNNKRRIEEITGKTFDQWAEEIEDTRADADWKQEPDPKVWLADFIWILKELRDRMREPTESENYTPGDIEKVTEKIIAISTYLGVPDA